MGIGVIVEFNLAPGGAAAISALMKERLPKTRSWPGCENIYLGTDDQDPNRVFLVEKWTSRQAYDRYREWAMQQADTAELLSYLIGEMQTTYLEDIGV